MSKESTHSNLQNPYQVVHVSNKRDFNRFIDYPYYLYRQVLPKNNWIPPLRLSIKEMLDTKLNPFFKEGGKCDQFLVTDPQDPNKILGRFSVSWAPSFVEKWKTRTAFFGFYEQVEDPQLAHFIFDFAKRFVKEQYQADELVGPINLTSNYECGLLVDSFDQDPFIQMLYNPPYYVQHFENSDTWEPLQDLYAFYFKARATMGEKVLRVTERLKKKLNIEIRTMDFSKMDRDSEIMREIYHDAWSDNWGFTPISKDEWNFISKDLKKIALKDFLLIGTLNGEPFGFSVTLPDLNIVLKGIPNGRLFPSGVFKLLLGLKKIKRGRMITMGVKKKYQHLGLGSLFYVESQKIGLRHGYDGGELSWVLASNTPMVNSLKAVGAEITKTYRIYKTKT